MNIHWTERDECDQCKKELTLENRRVCSACLNAVYCSEECHQTHWNTHKRVIDQNVCAKKIFILSPQSLL